MRKSFPTFELQDVHAAARDVIAGKKTPLVLCVSKSVARLCGGPTLWLRARWPDSVVAGAYATPCHTTRAQPARAARLL